MSENSIKNNNDEMWTVRSKCSVNLGVLILTVLCFFVYTVISRVGSDKDTAEIYKLYKFGALYGPSVMQDGQWYRLITYMFLHGGIEHLMKNMLMLYFIGNAIENLYGKWRYVVIYFASGIIAGLVSIMYNGYIGNWPICVGASGAIFGLSGAFAARILMDKGRTTGISVRQIVLFVLLSVYGGFTQNGIDNAAHIGGLVAGAVIGAVFYLIMRLKENFHR